VASTGTVLQEKAFGVVNSAQSLGVGRQIESNMVRQFCEICSKELEMKVLSEDAWEGFIWCQCSECKGIAPYKQSGESNASLGKDLAANKKHGSGRRIRNREKKPV
jgi:hypothetical protein